MDVVNWIISQKMHLIGTVQSNRFCVKSGWPLSASAPRGSLSIINQVNELGQNTST